MKTYRYAEIREKMEADIRGGRYASTRPLPSVRLLMQQYHVSSATIVHVMGELKARGIVRTVRGSGTFVAEGVLNRSRLIGLLIPDMWQALIFRMLSERLVAQGRANGYEVLVSAGTSASSRARAELTRRAVDEFIERRVEGVWFRPFVDEQLDALNHEVVEAFAAAKIPVVLIDSDVVQSPERSAYDVVGINHVDAGRKVAVHLIETGCKRIYYQLDRPSIVTRNRFFGVMGAVLMSGQVWNPQQVIRCRPEDVKCYRALFAQRKQAPDAIVCEDDEVAVRVYKTLLKCGKRVPQDVALTGCDDVPVSLPGGISLTTVHQPIGTLAQQACSALLARIKNPNIAPKEYVLDAPLVIRTSTK